MKILSTPKEIDNFLLKLSNRSHSADDKVVNTVKQIIYDVRHKGDLALKSYTEQFDNHRLSLKMPIDEINAVASFVDINTLSALKTAAARIRDFHIRQREQSWLYCKDGALLGQRITAIERVGIYVPGGKAAYPSTVLMNVIPAQVAGVSEIAVCVPCPNGEVNPYVMAALKMLDITEVYRIGGAQAISALAYGTETVSKVDKITGPGNIYVTTAKKLVFGDVGIDMIAGPSEVLIIADYQANPACIAADMLAQAEHDELASAVVITTSKQLANRIKSEIKKQLVKLPKMEIAQKSLQNYGAIITVADIKTACGITNQIAPEHLEIITKDAESVASSIRNAGAIFIGQWTPEALGDYAAGPNHTLPTNRTARFFSPLGVYDFVKRTSILSFSKKGFDALSETVMCIANVEGLDAHANTIKMRTKR